MNVIQFVKVEGRDFREIVMALQQGGNAKFLKAAKLWAINTHAVANTPEGMRCQNARTATVGNDHRMYSVKVMGTAACEDWQWYDNYSLSNVAKHACSLDHIAEVDHSNYYWQDEA